MALMKMNHGTRHTTGGPLPFPLPLLFHAHTHALAHARRQSNMFCHDKIVHHMVMARAKTDGKPQGSNKRV